MKTSTCISTVFIAFLLSACGNSDNDTNSTDTPPALDIEIPDSLTGGRTPATKLLKTLTPAAMVRSEGTNTPCGFQGADDDDPFRNGYETTKFMISAVATWTCIADTLIDVSEFIPHDGVIYESENDTLSDHYDPEEPTHYSVIDDSASQTSIYLFYAYDRDTPPVNTTEASFYISWNTNPDGTIEGKLIINTNDVNASQRDPEDPAIARLDFTYSDTAQTGDMFLRFDDNNPWADGFRIEVVKDLNANPLRQVFRARGIMNMKAQFNENEFVDEHPTLQLYTVSDQLGEGAAIAEFSDIALPLELNDTTDNHLGYYIADKNDLYFFDADQSSDEAWDWIEKTFTHAEYRGGRTTLETGGTWEPFNPSLDLIVSGLSLPDTYFSGTQCAAIGDSCIELINSVFDDGFAGQESNQGSDPQDWRSDAITNPEYLESVFPNGSNWDNAFDMSFTPQN